MRLPPLNALRAFVAAARAGGYVAAAAELDVSAAAVSQQVRKLEEFLGKRLFRRYSNRVILTDAGQAIYAGASDAFEAISWLSDNVAAGQTRSRLVISALPSVAQSWLAPRVAQFVLQHRSLRIDLRVEEDPVDFVRHDVDLRICYGANLYPELNILRLHHDEVLPLCSPGYLQQNDIGNGIAGVPDHHLIHTNWGPSFLSHPTWHAWFAKSGIARPEDTEGYHVSTSSLALDLARDGVGVALGQRMMAADDLAAGRLIPLSRITVALGHPYCLVHPHGKSSKNGLRMMIDWLVAGVGSA
jgi:LysR family glycine cleavage system transcriptional activator